MSIGIITMTVKGNIGEKLPASRKKKRQSDGKLDLRYTGFGQAPLSSSDLQNIEPWEA